MGASCDRHDQHCANQDHWGAAPAVQAQRDTRRQPACRTPLPAAYRPPPAARRRTLQHVYTQRSSKFIAIYSNFIRIYIYIYVYMYMFVLFCFVFCCRSSFFIYVNIHIYIYNTYIPQTVLALGGSYLFPIVIPMYSRIDGGQPRYLSPCT